MQLTWSLPRSPVTALCLLEDFLKLVPGDVVVQNGAGGSVGRVSPPISGRQACWCTLTLLRMAAATVLLIVQHTLDPHQEVVHSSIIAT